MSHRRPAPAERKETTEQHEHDERDVNEENEIRKGPVQHYHVTVHPALRAVKATKSITTGHTTP
jgi:hypothetical protein